MKARNASLSLLILLIILTVAIYKWRTEPKPKEVFDRTPAQLVYTKHALCRMDCRKIDRQDITEVMQDGVINLSKSNRRQGPCPTFALQGRTSDGQYIRIIFAQCNQTTKVVTCYDLKRDFVCNCPGDENKNIN